MKKYNAIIIGAGSIGGLKPYKLDNKKTKNILTVAHAFHKNKLINLIGFVDSDINKAIEAAQRWDCKAYESIPCNDKIDIVAICTPTETHLEVLKKVIKNIKPKIILLEKPCGVNLKEAEEMKKLCEENNIITVVDYIRRFDKAVQLLKQTFDEITVRSCVVRYGRGLKHEACHAIDLCNYLFGKAIDYHNVIAHSYADRDAKDKSKLVYFNYEYCDNVIFMPHDSRDYNIFEIDILTSKLRIRLIYNGLKMEVTQAVQEKTYGDYKSIDYKPIVYITELNKALSNMSDNLVNTLDGKAKPFCNIDDAIKVHEILEDLEN